MAQPSQILVLAWQCVPSQGDSSRLWAGRMKSCISLTRSTLGSARPLLQPWDTQTARAGTAVLLSCAQAERLVLDEMMASSRAFFRTTAMSVLQLSQNSVPGVWWQPSSIGLCCRGSAVWVQGRQGAR